DAALERRFQPVMINETTPAQTLEVLRGLRPHYADFHQVTITDDALIAAEQMSTRYIHDRFQPDNALDLVDEAAARVRSNPAIGPAFVRTLGKKLVTIPPD